MQQQKIQILIVVFQNKHSEVTDTPGFLVDCGTSSYVFQQILGWKKWVDREY